MKKKTFNILITILIWALFIFIGFIASINYEPKAETNNTDQVLKTWTQAVNAEYEKHGIVYRG